MPTHSCPLPTCSSTFTRLGDVKRHLNGEHLHCYWFHCPFCQRSFWQKSGAEKHAYSCEDRQGRPMPLAGIARYCDARDQLLERWEPGMKLPYTLNNGSGDAEMLDQVGNRLISYYGRHEVVIVPKVNSALRTHPALPTPTASPFSTPVQSSYLQLSSPSELSFGSALDVPPTTHLRHGPKGSSPSSNSPVHPHPALFNPYQGGSASPTATATQLRASSQPHPPQASLFLPIQHQADAGSTSYSTDLTRLPSAQPPNGSGPLPTVSPFSSPFPLRTPPYHTMVHAPPASFSTSDWAKHYHQTASGSQFSFESQIGRPSGLGLEFSSNSSATLQHSPGSNVYKSPYDAHPTDSARTTPQEHAAFAQAGGNATGPSLHPFVQYSYGEA
ncbi:hypothetical protein BKA62DRAFT_712137 [Auriculariales sp. MPI-PUGE-AT-0066]|nr:hypothetical protein BKA62DRAFT_712137 [Auriculariales sp. MPI-PUGE-AT-0066]